MTRFDVRGNWILIRIVPVRHTVLALPGSVEAPSGGEMTTAIVVAVGTGRMLEDGRRVPVDLCAPGDEVVLMAGRCVEIRNWCFGLPSDEKLAFVEAESVIAVVRRSGGPAIVQAGKVEPDESHGEQNGSAGKADRKRARTAVWQRADSQAA